MVRIRHKKASTKNLFIGTKRLFLLTMVCVNSHFSLGKDILTTLTGLSEPLRLPVIMIPLGFFSLFMLLANFWVGMTASFLGRPQLLVRRLKYFLALHFLIRFLPLVFLDDYFLRFFKREVSKHTGLPSSFFDNFPREMDLFPLFPSEVIAGSEYLLLYLVLLAIRRISSFQNLIGKIIQFYAAEMVMQTLGLRFFDSLRLLVNQGSIPRAQRINVDLRMPVVTVVVIVILTVIIFVLNHQRRYETDVLKLQKLARTGLKNEHFQTPKLTRHITIGILARYLVMLALIAASNKIPTVLLMTLFLIIQLSITIFVGIEGVLKDQFLPGWESFAALFNELLLLDLVAVGFIIKVYNWNDSNWVLGDHFSFCFTVAFCFQVLVYLITILVEFRGR